MPVTELYSGDAILVDQDGRRKLLVFKEGKVLDQETGELLPFQLKDGEIMTLAESFSVREDKVKEGILWPFVLTSL